MGLWQAEPYALAADELHVWVGTPRDAYQHHVSIEERAHVLDAAERARAERRRIPADHAEFVAARVMQRIVLSSYASGIGAGDWRFESGPHGRPRLAFEFAHLGLHFNLAHTEGMMAMAVARAPVLGVDVEKLRARPNPLRLAARYFSAAESSALAALAPEARTRRFFALWTLKEAWLKATGEGLSAGLHNASFTVSADEEFERVEFTADDATRWRFWHFAGPHSLAVALRADSSGASYRLRMLNFPYRPIVPSGQEQRPEA